MWYLLNTKTGQLFCEFAEHVPLDTHKKDDACTFSMWEDAARLIAWTGKDYEPVHKEQLKTKSK